MSETPERIWINGTPGVVCGEFDVEKFDGSVEYVRADMLQEIFARYSKAEADHIEMLERKLARLRAACGPIHEAADECDEWNHDDDNQAPVDAGTCRAIRAELTGGGDE